MTPSAPDAPTRTERLSAALERARAGDSAGLDEIVRELTPLLWHVARSQGVERADVADVVQHSWLELVSRLDGIRSPSALTAWLVTTTKREAWRLNRRRQTPIDPSTLHDVEAEVPDPASGLIEDERDRVLWRAFHQLGDRCRELLRVIAMVERPDYAVVGEALGMPHGSIGPTRGRCLAKLRALLLADPTWEAP
jgi:RNA polymerase sigma factor (sigma-70 family)